MAKSPPVEMLLPAPQRRVMVALRFVSRCALVLALLCALLFVFSFVWPNSKEWSAWRGRRQREAEA